ncbi:hypothetical protein DRQ33_05580 [bacterium]|nr:MAG: hypothetical protein DRQ33_05580 [bacterium]
MALSHSGCYRPIETPPADFPTNEELRFILNIIKESDYLIVTKNFGEQEIKISNNQVIEDIISCLNIAVLKPHQEISQDWTLIFIKDERVLKSFWIDSKHSIWGFTGENAELGTCSKSLFDIIREFQLK